MRNPVRLAAASTLAAMAIVGASATGAMAHTHHDDSDHPVNACGNSATWNKAEDDGYVYTTELNQVNCQIGKFNVNEQSADDAEVESEGNVSLLEAVVGEAGL